MANPNLSKYIKEVAAKRIKPVELARQHEFNGINPIKKILGARNSEYDAEYIYLPDNEDGIIYFKDRAKWYDSRENKQNRSPEYRLYYTSNDVMAKASVDDSVFICLKKDNTLIIIITPKDSTSENQLLWFFDINEVSEQVSLKSFIETDKEIDYIAKQLIEILGINIEEEDVIPYDELLAKFGPQFPSTYEFSEFARESCKDVSIIEDPDNAILKYLDMEEALFKMHERNIIQSSFPTIIHEKESIDVDSFIHFSLSVINRRKSRAGHSFENHLSYIFNEHNLEFSNGKMTENKKKPDFLFPGVGFYQDSRFPAEFLTMLGAKVSAKDRWRQVLSEADRVEKKHLITIQPAITVNQTDEMSASNLTLVIPQQIQSSYTEKQRGQLLNLRDFIDLVEDRQKSRAKR